MTLRFKVSWYLILLHVALASCAFLLFREKPLWFVLAELLLILSVLVGFRLVKAFFLPVEMIQTGTELIREREFGSHFREVGETEMDRLVGIYNQMVDQLREERLKLEEQNLFLEKVLEASPTGVVTLDPDQQIYQLNPAAQTVLGSAESLEGSPLSELPAPFDAELPRLTDGGSTILQIHGGRRLRVRRASFYDRGTQRGFLLLEELTEELQASERAAYGKLIRMMSHEVNNSVGVVRSLLESCGHYDQHLPERERAEFGQAMEVAVDRLLHLSSFMNGLARVVRIPAPESRPCDLTQLLSDIALLMGPELGRRKIQLDWSPPAEALLIECDKNQIEQVIVNIFQNAMEAIGSDGQIRLELGQRDGAAELSLIDSGPGLTADAASKLFTPFFSTKRDGQGVGLTLTREILSQHRFNFSLTNEPTGGARFRIRFSA